MSRIRVPRTIGFAFLAALVDGSIGACGLVIALWLDRDLQYGPQLYGVVLAMPALAYVFCALLLGHSGDRFGFRRTAAGALGLAALLVWLLPYGRSLPVVMALLLGRGMAMALFWPSIGGWLSRGADERQLPRRMAAYNLGWSSGTAVGSWAGGWAYATFGAAGAFRLFGALVGLAVIGVLFLPRLNDRQPDERPEPIASTPPDPGVRYRAWITNFGAFFVASSVRAHFPKFARVALDFGPTEIGSALGALAVVNVVVFIYLGLIHPHRASGELVGPSQLLAAAGLLGLCTLSPALALFGLLAIGAHQGIAFAASFYHSMYGRQDAARQGGINEAIVGSGGLFGAILGGLATSALPPSGAWWLALGVLLTVRLLTAPRGRWARLRPARAAA